MKKLLIMLCIAILAMSLSAVTWQVALLDDWGDGWNGGSLTVLVNGTAVLTGITLPDGAGPTYSDFTVVDGDEITTTYAAGEYSYENYYAIIDHNDVIVAESGGTWDSPGDSTPASITTPIVVDIPAGLPGIVTAPSPANGLVQIAINGSVAWTFGDNTATYDLWFGPAGNMEQVVSGAAVFSGTGSYAYTDLQSFTRYQWQVISHNAVTRLSTNGPVWSFKTDYIPGANEVGQAYYLGNLPTTFNAAPTITSVAASPGSMTITVPVGKRIASVDVQYTMSTPAGGGGWMNEQRSFLKCTNNGVTEPQVYAGVGSTAGTYSYNRTDLTLATYLEGEVTFELHAFRTWAGDGDLTVNIVDNASWLVVVHYEDIPTVPIFSIVPDLDAWEFPLTNINTASTKQFTITNTGSGTLAIQGWGTTGDYYSLSEIPALTELDYLESTTFTIQYLPTVHGGPHGGTATITHGVGGTRAVHEIDLTGNCIDPALPNFQIVPATAWDFGGVALQEAVSKQFQISNAGGSLITINPGDIYLTDVVGEFILTANTEIVELGTYNFTVSLTPLTTGPKSCTLNVQDNLTGRVLHSVDITALGIYESLIKIVDLQGSSILTTANLDWKAFWANPGNPSFMHWDNGNSGNAIGYTGGGTLEVAAKFDTDDYDTYAGMDLTQAKLWLNDPAATYVFKVWTGSNDVLNPEFEIYTQAFTPVSTVGWNTITIDPPIQLNGTDSYYIGYAATHAAGTYPAGCDQGAAVPNRGFLINNGGTWENLNSLNPALNYNWVIRGLMNTHTETSRTAQIPVPVPQAPQTRITKDDNIPVSNGLGSQRALLGFNVYRDASVDPINPTLEPVFNYSDPGLNYDTTYSYTVQAVHTTGSGAMSDPVEVTIQPPVQTPLPYTQSFDAATIPEGWFQTYSGALTSDRWAASNTANAGGTAYEMMAEYQNALGISRLISPPFDTDGITGFVASFKHFFDDWGAGVTAKLQYSTDLQTWYDAPWSISSGGGDVTGTVNAMITGLNYDYVYLAWVLDGNHFQFDYWYMDDVNIRLFSDAKDILTYSIPEQTGAAVIDNVNHTVEVEVGYSVPLTNLVASFTLSPAATASVDDGTTRVWVPQESGVTANDFTNDVIYRVEAENGTTQDWTVTVTNSPTASSEKEILAFGFAEQNTPAVIDRDNFTVDIEVRYGTDLTNLVPTFTLSDWATAWVNDEQQSSGVTANDYSERVDYVIRAEDDSEQVWRVTVSVHAPILVSMPFSEDFEGASIGLNIVNGAQPNFWTVGTATFNGGAKSAYISNDVVTFPYAYTNNVASVVHMYVDLDFPADCSQYDLNFNWKAQGESGWDFLKVYLTDIYTTPVAGTQMLVGNQIGNVQYNMGGADTWNLSNIVLPGTLSGQARRLVFSWCNDTSGGEQPPVALDDISLTFTLAGQDDLAATAIDGSFQGMVNTQVLFDVTVQNVGLVAQTEYTVELRSVDDRALLASLEVDQLLPVGEEETWTIAWTPDTIGTYNVYGQVVLTGDEDLDNDATDPMAFEVYAPIALPFVEDWATMDNGWAAGSTNWGLASTGNPAPAIQFSWSPTVTDYSIGLYSREIDATAATFVRFKYDYYLSNYSTSTLEGMRVWVYDGTNYYELDSMDNSAGSIPWTTKTWDISALVAGDIFQIIFDAWGANSYNINQWYIDNIALELMPALSQPADVVVSQAGGNVNVDWTDNGAEAYKVFASDDPTTFAGPGTIVNTNAYTTPVGANTKEFYYVTSFFDEGVVVLPTRATRRAPVQGTQPVKEAVETPKRITK